MTQPPVELSPDPWGLRQPEVRLARSFAQRFLTIGHEATLRFASLVVINSRWGFRHKSAPMLGAPEKTPGSFLPGVLVRELSDDRDQKLR
jgi:hypothetical protein